MHAGGSRLLTRAANVINKSLHGTHLNAKAELFVGTAFMRKERSKLRDGEIMQLYMRGPEMYGIFGFS